MMFILFIHSLKKVTYLFLEINISIQNLRPYYIKICIVFIIHKTRLIYIICLTDDSLLKQDKSSLKAGTWGVIHTQHILGAQ